MSAVQAPPTNITGSIQQGVASVGDTMNKIEASVSSGVQSVGTGLQQFGSQSATSIANADFLDTNSLIAKTVFILLILVVFMILLRVFVSLMAYFMSPTPNPYLVKGMLSGNSPIRISRDPMQGQYVVLPRSNNEASGLEFTWCFWLNLSSVNAAGANAPTYMNVFNVGNNDYESSPDSKTNGIATVNNGPGVYLTQPLPASPGGAQPMNLHIVMDSESVADADTTNSYVDIEDVPYNKWFHVALRVENMVMDVYINGMVTQRLTFQNLPRQNFNDVFLCQNGGFDGNISNLRYYSSALNVFDITSIVYWGPNLSTALVSGANTVSNTAKLSNYNYISSNWYFNKMGPGFA